MKKDSEFLLAWLASLQESLQITEKNIEEIESNKEINRKHAEIQSSLINKWLHEEVLEPDVKQDVTSVLERIKRRDQASEEELNHLKTMEASTKFMIEKLKSELT